ncbi:MAG: glutamate 5-kinase [Nevskiaceae bacterium]|nr:MAG: glutamate 5-kinase [Nevskiaceae bacterium]TBR74869.1 MAG: glutamate 5-kinase [Nevskiaceae bacterium]
MNDGRTALTRSGRWVVKVGSSLVTAGGRGVDHAAIANWTTQIAKLRHSSHEIVWVSSGAVAEGMAILGLPARPAELQNLQATAAIGQMHLMRAYQDAFERHGLQAAQILLTHEDVANRTRYLNARATLRALLSYGVVPVVNENDTVATDEIRFGDNDTLGALTCNLLEADVLVILTDQHGLYDADPRSNPNAQLISEGDSNDPRFIDMAGNGRGILGRGGMRTKIKAAQWAARSGAATLIAHGREPDVLLRLAAGETIGTLLKPGRSVWSARKRWIAHQLQVRGRLKLDAGAVRALREHGSSLLPIGVRSAEGTFERGDLVVCEDLDGHEIARGLIHYDATETARIIGHPSNALTGILGRATDPELIHRDDLVLSPQ